jgi:hypothetical protein
MVTDGSEIQRGLGRLLSKTWQIPRKSSAHITSLCACALEYEFGTKIVAYFVSKDY